jgi:acylphosphatase
VSGRVQGVFFRASTEQQAQRLGISGWVRNLRDGRVEVLACGDEQQLETFVKWLEIGPEYAKVTKIEVKTINSPDDLHGFRVLPSGNL